MKFKQFYFSDLFRVLFHTSNMCLCVCVLFQLSSPLSKGPLNVQSRDLVR